jgi:hypothetical protein
MSMVISLVSEGEPTMPSCVARISSISTDNTRPRWVIRLSGGAGLGRGVAFKTGGRGVIVMA